MEGSQTIDVDLLRLLEPPRDIPSVHAPGDVRARWDGTFGLPVRNSVEAGHEWTENVNARSRAALHPCRDLQARVSVEVCTIQHAARVKPHNPRDLVKCV